MILLMIVEIIHCKRDERTIAALPVTTKPLDTWDAATLLELTLPSSGLLVVFKLVEECVKSVLTLQSYVIFEEICRMHDEVNINLETMVKEERTLMRMFVDCELRGGKS